MMERLSWCVKLREIFDINSKQSIANKSQILSALTENLSKLPLKSPREYELSTMLQGFSFEDIFAHIQAMPRFIKWDELFDSLACLGIYSRGVSTLETVNLVRVKSDKSGENLKPKEKEKEKEKEKDREIGTLKEDFPLLKYHNLSEIPLGNNLRFLSIGGNLINNANFDFPSSLIALNLSYNIITEFQPQKPLSNLKFLNLSHNLLENLLDISGIITLNEFFISNNKLSVANFLFSIKNLCLLDISHNELENFEDLAMLSVSTRLHALNLTGNPLYLKKGYKNSISELFPRLIYMDPTDISAYSKYQQIGFCADRNKELNLSQKTTEFSSFTRELSVRINSSMQDQSSIMSTDYHHANASISLAESRIFSGECSPTAVGHKSNTPANKEKEKDFGKAVVRHHARSKSQSASGTLPTTPSLNSTCVTIANTSKKTHASVVKQKKPETAKISYKQFGNPASAMMIGPPAISNIFKGTQRKTRNISIDITRTRNNK